MARRNAEHGLPLPLAGCVVAGAKRFCSLDVAASRHTFHLMLQGLQLALLQKLITTLHCRHKHYVKCEGGHLLARALVVLMPHLVQVHAALPHPAEHICMFTVSQNTV